MARGDVFKTVARQRTARVSVPVEVVGGPFIVVPDFSPPDLADPDLAFTITITTFDPKTGVRRKVAGTFQGEPKGKSGRHAVGYNKIPAGCEVTVEMSCDKVRNAGLKFEAR